MTHWYYSSNNNKIAIASGWTIYKRKITILYNAFKYAVLYKMMVRLICGLSFYARSIYLYSRQWLHLFSLLTVSRRPLIYARDMISKRVVTPAGKAFQALRRSGVSPMGNGWFFRIWPIMPAVGPYFCNKERNLHYHQKMKLEWLCLPITPFQENIITAGNIC